MCSIFGMNTIVTMVCYGMCLSLKYVLDIVNLLFFNNMHCIESKITDNCLIINIQCLFVLLSISQVGLFKRLLESSLESNV